MSGGVLLSLRRRGGVVSLLLSAAFLLPLLVVLAQVPAAAPPAMAMMAGSDACSIPLHHGGAPAGPASHDGCCVLCFAGSPPVPGLRPVLAAPPSPIRTFIVFAVPFDLVLPRPGDLLSRIVPTGPPVSA